jgi:hypothetical protein
MSRIHAISVVGIACLCAVMAWFWLGNGANSVGIPVQDAAPNPAANAPAVETPVSVQTKGEISPHESSALKPKSEKNDVVLDAFSAERLSMVPPFPENVDEWTNEQLFSASLLFGLCAELARMVSDPRSEQIYGPEYSLRVKYFRQYCDTSPAQNALVETNRDKRVTDILKIKAKLWLSLGNAGYKSIVDFALKEKNVFVAMESTRNAVMVLLMTEGSRELVIGNEIDEVLSNEEIGEAFGLAASMIACSRGNVCAPLSPTAMRACMISGGCRTGESYLGRQQRLTKPVIWELALRLKNRWLKHAAETKGQ